MNITLYNDYHNTQATINIEAGDTLSRRRIKSINDRLCGSPDCACGDTLAMRGPQPDLRAAGLEIDYTPNPDEMCVIAV